MEYKVIYQSVGISIPKSFEKISNAVNDEIKNGWIPQGGVFYYSGYVVQAMIKKS